MKRVKWLSCPKCGHRKSCRLEIGQIWINDRDFEVRILDFGFEDVWVLYLDTRYGNKVAWKHQDFMEQYVLKQGGKK